jgi:hypothetical protein
MPTSPDDARRRLAALMEERRLELGLRWQDVAERGSVSLKALHSARMGNADIRPLTRQKIEDGLDWGHGSIRRILDDGDPLPAGLSGSGTLGGMQAQAVLATATASVPAPSVSVTPAVTRIAEAIAGEMAGEMAKTEAAVWDEINAHPEGTPADRIFTHPAEVKLMEMELTPLPRRVRWIAEFRFGRANPPRLDPVSARRAG